MIQLLFPLFVAAASAAEPLARTVEGEVVALGGGDHAEVFVFTSVRCGACLVRAREFERAGLDVVVVSDDPAGARASLVPALHAAGAHARVVADPTGAVRARLGVPAGDLALVVDPAGRELARSTGTSADDARLVAAARDVGPGVVATTGR